MFSELVAEVSSGVSEKISSCGVNGSTRPESSILRPAAVIAQPRGPSSISR